MAESSGVEIQGTGGAVTGGPQVLLRLEGLAIAVVAIGAFFTAMDLPWQLFAWLFLVPDLSFFGYLAGPKVGAKAYNTMHSYAGPAIVLVAGALSGEALVTGIALIWIGHIGVDRLFGYGLKYSSAFGHTHLGLLGRARRAAA